MDHRHTWYPPETSDPESLAPKESESQAPSVNLNGIAELGMTLAREINVILDFEISIGSVGGPLTLDTTLMVSRDLVGSYTPEPYGIRRAQAFFLHEIVEMPEFTGEPPDDFKYSRVAINNIEENGWGFETSLGFRTVAILSDTEQMDGQSDELVAQSWQSVYLRYFNLFRSTSILLVVFSILTPRMQLFVSSFLQKTISSDSCVDKILEIPRIRNSNPMKPFVIPLVDGNSDWIEFLGLPEIEAMARVGISARSTAPAWFMPERGVIFCQGASNPPLVGVRLGYYSTDNGRFIDTGLATSSSRSQKR
ncbi:hypothetical protein AA313_de0207189 [Arthrobotrys entomopaga]|nr:hypothetical protein AA313_de0207189 [Arthrobotrys entomopaga]